MTPTLLPLLGPDWLDAGTLLNNFIDKFGTAAVFAVAAIIIIETGLLFPILPGDSLLFTVGLFTGTGQIDLPIWLVALIMGTAAFIGPQIGYWIGRGVGPRIFAREDSRLFKKSYIDRTHAFFERHGGQSDHPRPVRAHRSHVRTRRGGRRQDAVRPLRAGTT